MSPRMIHWTVWLDPPGMSATACVRNWGTDVGARLMPAGTSRVASPPVRSNPGAERLVIMKLTSKNSFSMVACPGMTRNTIEPELSVAEG